jgi:hypothetical protein
MPHQRAVTVRCCCPNLIAVREHRRTTLHPRPASPSLRRRLACWLYEGCCCLPCCSLPHSSTACCLLIPALQSAHVLQVVLFVVFGAYFVWFWTRVGRPWP